MTVTTMTMVPAISSMTMSGAPTMDLGLAGSVAVAGSILVGMVLVGMAAICVSAARRLAVPGVMPAHGEAQVGSTRRLPLAA